MCVISMVMDHYQPLIPEFTPLPYIQQPGNIQPPFAWPPSVDLVALRRLIDEFNAAVAAAKTVDKLTGQPDCEDPEKIKLVERVAELEIRLALSALPAASRQRVIGALGSTPTGSVEPK